MYYRVKAKCGHVGRNHYIEKNFYVVASSSAEAAFRVRYMPRVKHHKKDAIFEVNEISYKEYLLGVQEHKEDKYFLVKNSTEQRLLAAVALDEIKNEPQQKHEGRTRNVEFKIKRQKILDRYYSKMLLEAVNE